MDRRPGGWQRLDPRNLLLDPVKTVGQFLVPALIAFVGLSSRRDDGMPWWSLPLLVLGAVALGVLPWLTTSWRVTRDPVPEAHRPAQQDHLHRSARPGPQRRPGGVAAAPGPRAGQGADRDRRRRRPDHPRRHLPRAGRRAPRPPAGPAAGRRVPVARRSAYADRTTARRRACSRRVAAGRDRLVVAALRPVQPGAARPDRRPRGPVRPVRRRPPLPGPGAPQQRLAVGDVLSPSGSSSCWCSRSASWAGSRSRSRATSSSGGTCA